MQSPHSLALTPSSESAASKTRIPKPEIRINDE
jgi:hypothetical protein